MRWHANTTSGVANIVLQSAALRQLNAILARIWKGEVYERIIIWHLEKESYLQEQGAMLEKTMFKLNMQNKAVQRCKRIIMQMVKGETATWIYTSMENMNEDDRAILIKSLQLIIENTNRG